MLERLAAGAVWRAYAPGGVVFLEGEPAPGLYYLQSGWLKVVKLSLEGREQILQFVGPGEVFNYLGILTAGAAPATVIALEHAGVWLLRRETLHQLLGENPQLALPVLEAMAQRLTELIQLVSDLSLRTVEARLAHLLLKSAQDDRVVRQRWATQSEMAARLGTVPDVVSRALRALVLENLIEVERNQIRILDRAGLAARAQSET
jgi:CRP/FNR family transcriptional regulator